MQDPHQQDEQLLFRQIAEGSEAAFKELFARYLPILGATVYRLVKSQEAVDDIIQETMLRVWISRDKLTEIEKPRSWVLKIAYYITFNYLRQKTTHAKAVNELSASATMHTNQVDEQFSYRQTQKLIKEAVTALAPQQKKIYLMSREQGLKIPEIAGQLGITESTVKNTLVKVLKLIREHVERSKGSLYSLAGLCLSLAST